MLWLTACASAHAVSRPPPPAPAPPAVAAPPPANTGASEPPRAVGAKALEGHLSTGPSRPLVAGTLRFDVARLPVGRWRDANLGAGFVLSYAKTSFRLRIDEPLFAEITITSAGATGPFQIFTGGSFGTGVPPSCGSGPLAAVPAAWTGFSARKWTDDGVDVEMARATFDPHTCSGRPLAKLRLRAAAIVPGFVYALRVPSAGGDENNDDLVVLLPPAEFVAAGGDPAHPLRAASTGSFTRLTFSLDGSGATSAALRITPARLALWETLRKTGRPVWKLLETTVADQALLLAIDILPQAGTVRGSVVVSLPKEVATPSAYGPLLRAVAGASS
jgi:hypothetical protein